MKYRFYFIEYNEFDPGSEWTLLTQVRYASWMMLIINKHHSVRVKNAFEVYLTVGDK